jgi:hypothetical protein
MASDDFIRQAAAIFAERLDVPQRVAERLMRTIRVTYTDEINKARGPELLDAAVWAADRLRMRQGDQLSTASAKEVRAALVDSGCPLCMSSANSRLFRNGRGGNKPGGSSMPTPSGASA